MFDKPADTSYRHLRPLYIKGYVNGRPMTKMLVDGGAAVNLMPYTTFRKLGKVPEDLIKTNMVLKYFGGNASEAKRVLNVKLTVGNKTIPPPFLFLMERVPTACCWGEIGSTQIVASLQQCINALSNGKGTWLRSCRPIDLYTWLVPISQFGRWRESIAFLDGFGRPIA